MNWDVFFGFLFGTSWGLVLAYCFRRRHHVHQATCVRCGRVRIHHDHWRQQSHQPRDLAICPDCEQHVITKVKQHLETL